MTYTDTVIEEFRKLTEDIDGFCVGFGSIEHDFYKIESFLRTHLEEAERRGYEMGITEKTAKETCDNEIKKMRD